MGDNSHPCLELLPSHCNFSFKIVFVLKFVLVVVVGGGLRLIPHQTRALTDIVHLERESGSLHMGVRGQQREGSPASSSQ